MPRKTAPIGYRVHGNGEGLISEGMEASIFSVFISGVKITGAGKIIRGSFSASVPADSDPMDDISPRVNIKNALVDGWFKIEITV